MSNELEIQATVPGPMELILTLADLKKVVEKLAVSPQRTQQFRAYLESLEWGLQNLAGQGIRIGFTILPAPQPQEYPKMLYREAEYQIANNSAEEQKLNSEGFSMRVPAVPPELAAPPLAKPTGKIVNIKFP